MYGLLNGTTANDLKLGRKSLLVFQTFVIPIIQEI